MALLKLQSLELFVFSVVGRKRDLVVLEIALLGRWYMVFLDERLVYLNLIGFFPIILQPILLILQMPVNAKLTWIFFFFVLVIGVQHILQDYFSLLIPISNILLENLERRCVTHQQFSMSLGFHNSSARKRINTTLQLWEVFLHNQEIKEQSVKEATLVSVESMWQWLICQSYNHFISIPEQAPGTMIRADPYLLRICCGRTCWNSRNGQKGTKIWSNFK